MNINAINNYNTSFGKINWGNAESRERTKEAFIGLKEANDINLNHQLNFDYLEGQVLKKLAQEDTTFFVAASLQDEDGYSDVFTLTVSPDIEVPPSSLSEIVDEYAISLRSGFIKSKSTCQCVDDLVKKTIDKANTFSQKKIKIKDHITKLMDILDGTKKEEEMPVETSWNTGV